MATLAREGFRPAGDLVFVAAADEEVGEGFGLPWLCENHPDAVSVDYALNEGAGERIELLGRALLHLLERREDELAVPGARQRARGSRLDAGDRGQRPGQGRAAARAARRLRARGCTSGPRRAR